MQHHGSRLIGLQGMAVRAVREVGDQLDLGGRADRAGRLLPGVWAGVLQVKDRPSCESARVCWNGSAPAERTPRNTPRAIAGRVAEVLDGRSPAGGGGLDRAPDGIACRPLDGGRGGDRGS